MDRTKRKCLAGSIAVHGALVFFVVFGSAFFASQKQAQLETLDPMTMVQLSDQPTSSPNPVAEPPPPKQQSHPEAQPPPPPQPPVRVVKPAPKPAKPEPDENDEAPVIPTDKGTLPKPPENKKTVAKHPSDKSRANKPVPNLGHLVEKQIAITEDKSGESRAQDQHRRDLASAINDARSSITKEGSKSTDIALPGNLGPAFANYNQMIYSAYKARYDEEVLQAGEFATEESRVRVSITISRDGNVTESKVVTRSGNRVLDELVRRVLRKVKFIAPFPAEATDSERAFDIQFNLKPNGQLG